jgi:HEAT repeat protein
MQNQNANPASPAVDAAALAQAFDALKTYDWGSDRKTLAPIDDAVTATRGDAAAGTDLETRLAAVLGSGLSRAAKDFACRTLTVIGTAASVPALAALLGDAELSHMARYALERIQASEAAAALRDALPKLTGKLKIGAIGSLGVRRDEASVPALAALIGSSDSAVATAAATALGDIGCEAGANLLCDAIKAVAPAVKPAVADATLVAAERLLADGNKTAALATYNTLLAGDPPKYIRLAASRGTLWVASKKG